MFCVAHLSDHLLLLPVNQKEGTALGLYIHMVLNWMYSWNSTIEETPRERITVTSSLNELSTDQVGNSAGISDQSMGG
jgi:hypothetical protein